MPSTPEGSADVAEVVGRNCRRRLEDLPMPPRLSGGAVGDAVETGKSCRHCRGRREEPPMPPRLSGEGAGAAEQITYAEDTGRGCRCRATSLMREGSSPRITQSKTLGDGYDTM